jgi:hypothetical protein
MVCTKMLDFSNEESKKSDKNVLSVKFDRLGQKIDRLGQAQIQKKGNLVLINRIMQGADAGRLGEVFWNRKTNKGGSWNEEINVMYCDGGVAGGHCVCGDNQGAVYDLCQ